MIMLFKLRYKEILPFLGMLLCVIGVHAQSYRNIVGWNRETNQKIESFLNTTLIIKERKVAVFDCDGTLFGQSPYYLADEAIYAFARDRYAFKNDNLLLFLLFKKFC